MGIFDGKNLIDVIVNAPIVSPTFAVSADGKFCYKNGGRKTNQILFKRYTTNKIPAKSSAKDKSFFIPIILDN